MLKNLLKQILTNTGPKLYLRKYIRKKIPILTNINLNSFGTKNKNKKFYVIRRSPGAGFFSNLTYVLAHLLIAEKYKFIPVVDMENHPTIYNEKRLINKTYNSWEYYFNKVSKYELKDVYNSKSVILTSNFFESHMPIDMSLKKEFHKIIKKYIHINTDITKEMKRLKKKYFKNNDKILGVHFRGTTYKTARGHAFPIPPKLMKKNIDALIKKFKYNKIFVVTEESDYLEYMKFYSKAKFGIMNRVHGAFIMASYGKPSIVIGNDSRARMPEEIGLKHYFVNDVDCDLLNKEYDFLKNGAGNFKKRFQVIKEKALNDYMKILSVL